MASECRSIAAVAMRLETREQLLEVADQLDGAARLGEGAAMQDWRLKGQWVRNCNCAFGCPCYFNGKPTYGVCRSLAAMHIEEGYFHEVKLDGLNWIVVLDLPGPEHEGNGKFQAIIDERATAEQREALVDILSGRHSEPGTVFNIFSLITTRVLDPVFAPIEFSFDLKEQRARVSARSLLVTNVEPVRNPVTRAERHIQSVIPEPCGVEVAMACIESMGAFKFVVSHGHSSLALVEQTPRRGIELA
jgi:hypothetical protein